MVSYRPEAILLAATLCGCQRHGTHGSGVTAQPALSIDASAPVVQEITDAGLLPLTKAKWLERLDLPGGYGAFVSVPLGTTEPRPVVVAAHGAGDRAEWACGAWRGVTDAYPFIVCPQGSATGRETYYWPSTDYLQKVIDLALAALRLHFGEYVGDGPMTYVGFSAGAIYGAALLTKAPTRFPLAMMSEGGYAQLTEEHFAQAYARGGGRRVLLGCSTGGGCLAKFGEAERQLKRAGVEARINDAGMVAHNLNGTVVTSLRRDWPWLVDGQSGWEHYRTR
jgi:predicted esterase